MVTVFDSKQKVSRVFSSSCRFKSVIDDNFDYRVFACDKDKDEVLVGTIPSTSVPFLDVNLFHDSIRRLNAGMNSFMQLSDDILCVFPRDVIDNVDWSQVFRDAERGPLTVSRQQSNDMAKG